MIKSNLGAVKIAGPGPVIFAELEEIIRSIYKGLVETLEDETEARRMIYKVVENGLKDEEEVFDEDDKKAEKIRDLISQLVNELEGDEDDED